ncbi:4-phosphopantetheinyl transferase [Levilactobacillus namurensis DSM 19117]|uniref:Holo-[acyl-carrier-protein] synthase n=1 Tax=Levilactobacillus namurensis DSM 19117 TaxID=1423773 RepID=A0A0R1JY84_9LACO|nr:holo-ACP synthase [Levilactobacillus namurensis]KRK75896.1 4-phosphopantetheinyl transferase [Levilactobacillus namurensis DSM 19117]GEO74888.1 holo-[acyl-carrier-protein] synthase [Levilactobacillus namurensis]HJE46048.1 holo-ACP synthase [Levilactobacillus namurensis]
MIYGTGIDITDLARVQQVVSDYPAFLTRVLTPGELSDYQRLSGQRAVEFLAGRWSVKESYGKALGTGIGKAFGFQDLEVRDNAVGRPEVRRQPFRGIAHVSISHTATVVMTQVILERGQ